MELEDISEIYINSFIYEDPIYLEELLQYGDRSAIKEHFSDRLDVMHQCIFLLKFKNASIYFKFLDTAYFKTDEGANYELKLHIKRNFTEEVFGRIRQTLTPRRYQLMLQILLIFFTKDKNPSDAKKVLRLIWASVEDPIIMFQAFENSLKYDLSSEEIKDIYNFYSEAVGAVASKLQPRNLKQLCRTMIRSELYKKDLWFATEIDEMHIPTTLKEFLNLDEKISSKTYWQASVTRGESFRHSELPLQVHVAHEDSLRIGGLFDKRHLTGADILDFCSISESFE